MRLAQPFALAAAAVLATAPTATAADPLAAMRARLPEAAEIDLALSAAPPHLRDGARVLIFGQAGFHEVRAGGDGLTCLVNRDAFFYGAGTLKPTCWDRNGQGSYLPVMLRVGELLAQGADAPAIRQDIDKGFADGRFHTPDHTGVAYMLAGDLIVDPISGAVTKQTFPGHYMIYAWDVTNADIGYTREGASLKPGLPLVFASGAGGSRLGYIIVGHAH